MLRRCIAAFGLIAVGISLLPGAAQARIFFYGGPFVVAPYYAPYPYYPYYYPPPAYYPPPPAYYAPPPPSASGQTTGQACFTPSNQVCTLSTPGPLYANCSCPSGNGRVPGRIGS
jgi:hypothetical protein